MIVNYLRLAAIVITMLKQNFLKVAIFSTRAYVSRGNAINAWGVFYKAFWQ